MEIIKLNKNLIITVSTGEKLRNCVALQEVRMVQQTVVGGLGREMTAASEG